jgi:ferredoxin-NADP reductase
VRITQIVPRTSRITSYVLAPSRPLSFTSGQWVDIRLSGPDEHEHHPERSYSIASAPERAPELELAIERIDEGEVSPYFHERAAVGDALELRGPFGDEFVWSVRHGGPVLWIGGGSGVVPLMSMFRHRSARRSTLPVAMLVSARTWDELLFRDELIALQQERAGAELVLAITRESARRPGDHERRIDPDMVSDLVARLPAPPRHVFVCGGNRFAEAATQAAIDSGLDPSTIRTQGFG